MSKLVFFAIILGIVFILTYDPKSRTLAHIIEEEPKKKCCMDPTCIAKHPSDCKNAHYEAIQFGGDIPSGFVSANATSYGGAILGP
jgi:hypothetical protein